MVAQLADYRDRGKTSLHIRNPQYDKIFIRLPSKQDLRWLRTRKPLAYRESTHLPPSSTAAKDNFFVGLCIL